MNKPVIIIGAGGHARVIADILHCSNRQLLGVLDDSDDQSHNFLKLGKISEAAKWANQAEFIIGIGSNTLRLNIASLLQEKVLFTTAVHPSATVADDVELGEGTVVMAGVVINTGTVLGKHCIVNTSCSVDHDCIIGNFVHLSPGVHVAGHVRIGDQTWLGIGATVVNSVSICNDCIIGAGGGVIKHLDESGVYIGLPVRYHSPNIQE